MLQTIFWILVLIALLVWSYRLFIKKRELEMATLFIQLISITLLFSIMFRNHPF